MAKKDGRVQEQVTVGQRWYEEVLQKPLFDKDHPRPLTGVREFTVNHLFAKIWSRSDQQTSEGSLTLRERRFVTIALLAAQGHITQLKDHVRGACRARISEGEINELMLQVAHYSDWAAGDSGQKVAHDVFDEERQRDEAKTKYNGLFASVRALLADLAPMSIGPTTSARMYESETLAILEKLHNKISEIEIAEIVREQFARFFEGGNPKALQVCGRASHRIWQLWNKP